MAQPRVQLAPTLTSHRRVDRVRAITLCNIYWNSLVFGRFIRVRMRERVAQKAGIDSLRLLNDSQVRVPTGLPKLSEPPELLPYLGKTGEAQFRSRTLTSLNSLCERGTSKRIIVWKLNGVTRMDLPTPSSISSRSRSRRFPTTRKLRSISLLSTLFGGGARHILQFSFNLWTKGWNFPVNNELEEVLVLFYSGGKDINWEVECSS